MLEAINFVGNKIAY